MYHYILWTERGIERWTDYTVLFFFLTLTTYTTQTSLDHHCNSDVYSSASGMDDLQQSTTLQYCLIDNCTIIRNDTGQQLDIVYTTQSHLVVTPTDGKTSVLISTNDPELFCSTPNTTDNSTIVQVIGAIVAVMIMLVSSSIVVVHMIFKELRGTFGKLLILYNITKIGQLLSAMSFISYTPQYCVTLNDALLSFLLLVNAISSG